MNLPRSVRERFRAYGRAGGHARAKRLSPDALRAVACGAAPKWNSGSARLYPDLGRVSFYHYDPCAQLLSKVVRGFQRDLDDAGEFMSGTVDPQRLRILATAVPGSAYAKYPSLSRSEVEEAVEAFLASCS